MPVKYSQGEDGLYYEDMSYTKYGSTVCQRHCDQSADDSIQDATTAAPSTSAATSTSTDDFLSSLPVGWVPTTKDTPVSLILGLSISLAFVITLIMVGLVVWRKGVRRKKARHKDLEVSSKRQRSRPTSQADDSNSMHKDALRRIKLWSKAKARWNALARQNTRKRKGPRLSAPTPPVDVAVSSSFALWSPIDSPETVSPLSTVTSDSPSSSPSPSRRGSVSSTSLQLVDDPEDRQSLSTPLASPPAYYRNSSASQDSVQFGRKAPYNSIPFTRDPLLSDDSLPDAEEPVAYAPSSHFAHIAVDTKTHLHQLSQLASAPPSAPSLSEVPVSGSAPVWQDEVFEDFSPSEPSTSTPQASMSSQLARPSLFPPPPSVSTVPSYDYSYAMEDAIPSLPSFEMSASTIPSAPPLDDMEDLVLETSPSAPPLPQEDDISDKDGLTEQHPDYDPSVHIDHFSSREPQPHENG